MTLFEKIKDLVNPDTPSSANEGARIHTASWQRIKDLKITMCMTDEAFDKLALEQTGKDNPADYTKQDWVKLKNKLAADYHDWKNGNT